MKDEYVIKLISNFDAAVASAEEIAKADPNPKNMEGVLRFVELCRKRHGPAIKAYIDAAEACQNTGLSESQIEMVTGFEKDTLDALINGQIVVIRRIAKE
jgi:hypothetical protein